METGTIQLATTLWHMCERYNFLNGQDSAIPCNVILTVVDLGSWQNLLGGLGALHKSTSSPLPFPTLIPIGCSHRSNILATVDIEIFPIRSGNEFVI